MFLFGPPNIEKLKARRDVQGLIKALVYKDPKIQESAAKALGEINDPCAVEPLIAALKGDSGVRTAAAEALGNIGDPRAVEPLIAVLEESGKGIVEAVVDLCMVFVNGRWIYRHVRYEKRFLKATVNALAKLGWIPEQANETAVWYWATLGKWELCISLGEISVPVLVKMLDDYQVDNNLRCNVAQALAQIGNKRAIEPLQAKLKEPFEACCSKYYPSGTKSSQSHYEDEQAAFATALVKLGAIDAVIEVLSKEMQKWDWHRYEINHRLVEIYTEALVASEDSKVVPVLAEFLLEHGSRWVGQIELASFFAHKLGELGLPDCVEPLITATQDKHKEIRESAARSLIMLYQHGDLPESLQQRILAKRAIIKTPHDDYFDGESCEHHDKGIGMDFPL